VSGLLPPRLSASFDRIEPFGFMIVIAMLATGVLWKVVGPIVSYVVSLFLGFAGF